MDSWPTELLIHVILTCSMQRGGKFDVFRTLSRRFRALYFDPTVRAKVIGHTPFLLLCPPPVPKFDIRLTLPRHRALLYDPATVVVLIRSLRVV